MSLLLSPKGCPLWHRRLQCVALYSRDALRVVRHYSTSHHFVHDPSIRRTRNIGIIAHIDAVCVQLEVSWVDWLTLVRARRRRQSACSIIVVSLAGLEVWPDFLIPSYLKGPAWDQPQPQRDYNPTSCLYQLLLEYSNLGFWFGLSCLKFRLTWLRCGRRFNGDGLPPRRKS